MRKNLFREEVIQSQKPGVFSDPVQRAFIPTAHGIYLCYTSFVIIIIILIFGHYPKIERASGIINPSGGVVRIYSPKSGIVDNLLVKEGQKVRKGQELFEIRQDKIAFKVGDVAERGLAEINNLAEQAASRIKDLPTQQAAEKRQIEHEISSIKLQKFKLLDRLDLIKKRIEIRRQKTEKLKELLVKKSISVQEYNDATEEYLSLIETRKELEGSIVNFEGKLHELTFKHKNIAKKYKELAFSAQENISNLNRQSSDLSLQQLQKVVAPVDGLIASIQAYKGQNVETARPILAIIPDGSTTQAHIFFSSRSLGKVKVGQKVTIAIDSFPVELYGAIKGEIISISSTVLSPQDMNDADIAIIQNPSFRVVARLEKDFVEIDGRPYFLQPGITVSANVITHQRQVYEWLLEPILRAIRR